MNVAMEAPSLVDRLKSFDFFASLDDAVVGRILPQISILKLEPGTELFREGEAADALYLVFSGAMEAVLSSPDGKQAIHEAISAGEMVGEIQLLVGGRRTATVVAIESTELLRLPKTALLELEGESPEVMEKITSVIRRRLRKNQLKSILPQLFSMVPEETLVEIEENAEWIELARKQVLFNQGDPGDCMYILVVGRLRAAATDARGRTRIFREIAQGEVVGEMGFFSGEPRSATVSAVRNSMLIKLTPPEFQYIVKKYPQVMMTITKRLISRLRSASFTTESHKNSLSLAVVPTAPDVPTAEFVSRLGGTMLRYGSTLHLSSERFNSLVGVPDAAQKIASGDLYNFRLNTWLDNQEDSHRFVLFETDSSASLWTQRCLQHADQIVVLAWADSKPDLGVIAERFLGPERGVTDASLTLVLLHRTGNELPTGTHRWLEMQKFDEHYHIRWDSNRDIERMARMLTGNAIGVVLGGGGARGFAHIGVLQAMEEAGIPIDVIGGTSMGAIVSSQHALGWSCNKMAEQNRRGWIEMKPLSEYTLPLVSFLRGEKVEQVARMFYGDTDIEDLWIKFFCISSNISKAKENIHTRGLLRKAVQASASLPGVVVPVIDHGELLIDGGLINNVPGDVMREKCKGYVIAVNVGSETILKIENDKIPSPWEIAWSRIAPMRDPIRTISIFDVLLSATFIASDARLEEVKNSADFYLRPPLSDFRLLDMEELDAIRETGYRHAKEQIAQWQTQDQYQRMMAQVTEGQQQATE